MNQLTYFTDALALPSPSMASIHPTPATTLNISLSFLNGAADQAHCTLDHSSFQATPLVNSNFPQDSFQKRNILWPQTHPSTDPETHPARILHFLATSLTFLNYSCSSSCQLSPSSHPSVFAYLPYQKKRKKKKKKQPPLNFPTHLQLPTYF